MLKDLYRVLTGRLSWEMVCNLRRRLIWSEQQLEQVVDLKRKLSFAEAAIAELKSQLPADWQAQRKAASDSLGEAVIKDMQSNPQAFLPPKEPV